MKKDSVLITTETRRKTESIRGNVTNDGVVSRSSIEVENSKKGLRDATEIINESTDVGRNGGLGSKIKATFGKNRDFPEKGHYETVVRDSGGNVVHRRKVTRDLL